MYVTTSKKIIIAILIFIIIFSVIFALPALKTSSPNYAYCIVIDAGHGGIDGGTIGIQTNIDENSLNLEYAKCLKSVMEKYNIKVVMTRNSLNGLYNQFADDKKLDDMARRKEIIEKSNADIIISIHMNSFALPSCHGAQVFYAKDNLLGKALAESIQSIFVQTLPNARNEALVGDYYILNCNKQPCVIVECGYLSNPEEEILLQQENYKKLVCNSIFIGVLKFLSI